MEREMHSKRTDVQKLDDEKLDSNVDEPAGAISRIFKRKLRDLHFKGFGFNVRYRQQDEQGSEDS